MVRSLLLGAAQQVANQLASGVDRAFAATALQPPRVLRARSSAEALGHAERLSALSVIESFYNRPELVERPDALFPRPPAIAPTCARVRRYGRQGEVLDLYWPSEFEPLWDTELALQRFATLASAAGNGAAAEPPAGFAGVRARLDRSGTFREKYHAVAPNRIAHARWFRHREGPRPCALFLHGYMTGEFAIEERMLPVQRLFSGGMDVVLGLLPFHGARRDARRGFLPPAFPSNDPRFTVEGFRQMVFDHTALLDYLLAGRVAQAGVLGMSLGGYAAALLSTLDARLAFSVLYIPLAAIDAFAHDNGRMIGATAERAAQAEALRRAQWPVSPLARPPRVPPERVVVIGASADRVTGTKHSARLAAHFDAPHVVFDGGHLLQVGRAQAFAPVWAMLREAGCLVSAV